MSEENLNSSKGFKVVIYESELRQIQAWTAKYPDRETGGDLFGLWSDETTAVVQLVLGPGKNCRGTTMSFYQDVGYLEQVGNKLTNKDGLCHIGEWHSHHTLGLTCPSGGDENTVWSNMHRYGLERFVLFITTINSSMSRRKFIKDVQVDGYLFQMNSQNNSVKPLQHSSSEMFHKVPEESPFRLANEEEIANGAKSLNSDKDLAKFSENPSNTTNNTSLTPNDICTPTSSEIDKPSSSQEITESSSKSEVTQKSSSYEKSKHNLNASKSAESSPQDDEESKNYQKQSELKTIPYDICTPIEPSSSQEITNNEGEVTKNPLDTKPSPDEKDKHSSNGSGISESSSQDLDKDQNNQTVGDEKTKTDAKHPKNLCTSLCITL